MAMYVGGYVWHERTTIEDEYHMVVGDRELVQADAIATFARCYWPTDLAKPFVRQNWCVHARECKQLD